MPASRTLYQLGQNVFPALNLPPLSATFAASLPNGTNAFLLNPGGRSPYITQWNLSIQHSFSNNDMVEAKAHGYKNTVIAEKLSVSVATAKRDLQSIFEKLGVSDPLELTFYAIDKNIR